MRRTDAEFVERMGTFFEDEGRPYISGRIFGRLLLRGRPMSLDDIARELRISKASVSTDARNLVLNGILVRSTRPGDRRHFYAVADDLPFRSLQLRLERMRRFRQLVTDARRLPGAEPGVRARLTELDEAYDYVLGVVDRALARGPISRGRSTRTRAFRR